LVFLRDYWRKTRPQGWLFPSRVGTQHVTPDAVRLVFRSALRATQVYTHISVEHLGRTRSPLDLLGTPESSVLG
jgi:hypothetical protein